MTSRQREHFASLLRAERLQLNETLKRVQSAKHDAVDDSELQRANREPVTGGAGVSPTDDDALEARALLALDDVSTALELLSDHPDRYGVCDICNGPIAATRLEVVPATRRCGRHADGAPALRILT